MNNERKMLDCTLRDGGYVNDWDFGHSVITSTYKRLELAGVEYIEVGFLDDRRPFDYNRTIFPDTESLDKVFSNVKKGNAIPVAMIDYGTCSLDNLADCKDTFIDGIRVIFKKDKIEEALPYCKAIKEKGYKLFIQAVSITSYSDIELLEYIEKINEVKPYAFSIVDTYGLLDKIKLTKYFYLVDNNLDSNIKLGYHAHNNFQLGFSNTMEFLAMRTERELIADSTVYGMGKSAGNCTTELLAMHMNQYYEKKYDISQLMEIIDTDLMAIYKEKYWGYSYMFYISALHDCHPDYVKFLLDKKTLSVSAINEILCNIPQDIKLLFNKQYIHEAYVNYQTNDIDDSTVYIKLENTFKSKKILILGPGKSIATEKDQVNRFIKEETPIVIAINFSPDLYDSDYIFISNAKRYSKLVDVFANQNIKSKIIATSNIKELDCEIDYKLNYEALLKKELDSYDNALILLLNFFIRIGVEKVWLAGFDGYLPGSNNYYEREYNFVSEDSLKTERNIKMSNSLSVLNKNININFITKSIYEIFK